MNSVKFIQDELMSLLMSFVRTEPNLYEYISFNIWADYYIHEQLFYFLNWVRIKFKQVESNRIYEQPDSTNTRHLTLQFFTLELVLEGVTVLVGQWIVGQDHGSFVVPSFSNGWASVNHPCSIY